MPPSFKLSSKIALIGLVCLAVYNTTQAQTVQDPKLAALIEAGQFAELQKQASARIATKPDDIDAHTALAIAASNSRDTDQREAALQSLEACAQRLPAAAPCHWGVGSVAGALAMSGGMMKAMTMAPKVKAAFVRALEADPLYTPARSGLVQYYLMAPGVAGGSVSKAQEAASAEQARQPDFSRLLQAQVQMHEKQWSKAEASLAAVSPAAAAKDKSLREELQQTWLSLGFNYINNKEPAKAKTIMERLASERADSAYAWYGLGRALTDLGKLDEALAMLQKSAALKDADKLPVDYRLGVAYQAKGDKTNARAALEKALKATAGSSNNRKDAQKRLDELKAQA